ncbi:unnamed protein product, partial [Laminaria digitata]
SRTQQKTACAGSPTAALAIQHSSRSLPPRLDLASTCNAGFPACCSGVSPPPLLLLLLLLLLPLLTAFCHVHAPSRLLLHTTRLLAVVLDRSSNGDDVATSCIHHRRHTQYQQLQRRQRSAHLLATYQHARQNFVVDCVGYRYIAGGVMRHDLDIRRFQRYPRVESRRKVNGISGGGCKRRGCHH